MAREIEKLGRNPDIGTFGPGTYPDGGGLRLVVDKGTDGRPTRHRWTCRIPTGAGKSTDRGLGPAHGPNRVPVHRARVLAAELRAKAAAGELERPHKKTSDKPTLGTFIKEWWRENESQFNPGTPHGRQWERTLLETLKPIHGKHLDEIATDDVLTVLKPHWQKTPETARRDRSRLEKILDAAAAAGHRDINMRNPAAWKGHLEHLLVGTRKRVEHHEACDWRQAPLFMKQLRGLRLRSISSLALEFTILTCARSGEVRGTRFGELDGPVWTIPAERMKAHQIHKVPLSWDALDIVHPRQMHLNPKDADLIFPGIKSGTELSDMSLLQVIRRMGYTFTVHGFRSTFRDWAADNKIEDDAIIEMCLAHTVGSAVERAYRRTTAFERRTAVMDAWATFLRGRA